MQHRPMTKGADPKLLPFWAAYLRAAVLAFLAVFAVDWIAFALWEKWIALPYLAAIAVVWPAVMTAIT